jgi:tRNA-uridine 2-sulfurtransferase
MIHKNKTVYVGLSGGVDSSVAALRLKQQGYAVVGVFIKVWHPPFMVCNWEAERLDAMRVAAHLEIPFLTCPAEDAYRDAVAEYFIKEYTAGRTPNPDVLCNKEVKFGAFLQFALARGADYIATGHYAQKITTNDTDELHRGVDPNKDQSYFLWSLSSAQLEKSLFPVGDTPKEMIRAEAAASGIPIAQKKDSQGVCFLGHIDIPEFLSHYVTFTPGPVCDVFGTEIGTHQGALTYTIGQRHGFTLTTKDTSRETMYVVGKDIITNTLVVSTTFPITPERQILTLTHPVIRKDLSVGDRIEAQCRYRQKPFLVEVESISNEQITILLKESIDAPAAGQSCVLYDGSLCIGGGILA